MIRKNFLHRMLFTDRCMCRCVSILLVYVCIFRRIAQFTHLSTPPENWTVRAFLQLTPRLSNNFTAAWLTFTFPQLFAVAATLKFIDYNVAMTFILLLLLIIIIIIIITRCIAGLFTKLVFIFVLFHAVVIICVYQIFIEETACLLVLLIKSFSVRDVQYIFSPE